jgi:hypothetical protein
MKKVTKGFRLCGRSAADLLFLRRLYWVIGGKEKGERAGVSCVSLNYYKLWLLSLSLSPSSERSVRLSCLSSHMSVSHPPLILSFSLFYSLFFRRRLPAIGF